MAYSSKLRGVFFLVLSLVLVAGARAGEQEFPKIDCAVTPPEGWTAMPNPDRSQGIVAVYTAPDEQKLVLLMVDEQNAVHGPVDEAFAADFDKGVDNEIRGKRLWGKFIEMAGIKTYERLGEAEINGKSTSMLMRVLPANGRYYIVQGISFSGKADMDGAIIDFLESFRFLKPPVMAQPKSEAFKVGYVIGKVLGAATGLAIVAGVIVGLVFLVIRLVRGPKSRRRRRY